MGSQYGNLLFVFIPLCYSRGSNKPCLNFLSGLWSISIDWGRLRIPFHQNEQKINQVCLSTSLPKSLAGKNRSWVVGWLETGGERRIEERECGFLGFLWNQVESFFFLIYLFFNWKIMALQNFVFCQTSTWISCRYTYLPSLLNLPPISLPIPLL